MSQSDDELSAELGRLIADADQPPAPVVDAAIGSFAWRTIDADLASLTFDSADPQLAAGTRGETARRLAFESRDLAVDIEIIDDVVGIVHDVDGALIRCETADGVAWSRTIVENECRGPLPGSGPIRIVLSDAAGRPTLVTPWFLP